MLSRLRFKFVCINMVIVTVMLAVTMGMVLHFTREDWAHSTLQMMHAVSSAQEHPDHPIGPKPPGLDISRMDLPYFILQQDERGDFLCVDSDHCDVSDGDMLRQVAQLALSAERPDGVLLEHGLRYARIVPPDGEMLLVFADMSMENSVMFDLAQNCALIGLISLLAFLGISQLLARWAIKPVENAWAQQRQFVADASHELKTPLTVVMTNAELLQDPATDPAAHPQLTENILTMSRRMRELVEQLLELARADKGSIQTAFSDVDLSRLISDALLPFEPLFFERTLLLESEIEPAIRLRGSEDHLRQLPDILLDNALKYAAPNSTVRLRLKKQGSHCILSVSNPGDPIPSDELDRLFTRFYRADKAREGAGYGLGLAIAHTITAAHRGRIWAESSGGVNTFHIQLPL